MTESIPRCCIIIPVYRHYEPLPSVLKRLEPYGLKCFLVDDGNGVPLGTALGTEINGRDWVSVLRMPVHGGKGAACVAGARLAQENGFSHAIFVDADDQHDVADIPRMLSLMR